MREVGLQSDDVSSFLAPTEGRAMTDAERKAFDAMLAALCTIHEVDDIGEGIATVNIDYVAVTEAFALVDALRQP